jgi:hypothetical protein
MKEQRSKEKKRMRGEPMLLRRAVGVEFEIIRFLKRSWFLFFLSHHILRSFWNWHPTGLKPSQPAIKYRPCHPNVCHWRLINPFLFVFGYWVMVSFGTNSVTIEPCDLIDLPLKPTFCLKVSSVVFFKAAIVSKRWPFSSGPKQEKALSLKAWWTSLSLWSKVKRQRRQH